MARKVYYLTVILAILLSTVHPKRQRASFCGPGKRTLCTDQFTFEFTWVPGLCHENYKVTHEGDMNQNLLEREYPGPCNPKLAFGEFIISGIPDDLFNQTCDESQFDENQVNSSVIKLEVSKFVPSTSKCHPFTTEPLEECLPLDCAGRTLEKPVDKKCFLFKEKRSH